MIAYALSFSTGMSALQSKFEGDSHFFIAVGVSFTDDFICLALSDGREVKTPLEFYPRLRNASSTERENCQLIGLGTGITWPDLDEDLSVKGIVLGWKAVI